MRVSDLWYMSISSLWKRKVRTVLTVLGVVIGTASIVVMVSLGLGLNRSTMADIEANGGLTTIEVMEKDRYTTGKDSESSKEIKHLDDALVEELTRIPHVKVAAPVLSISVLAKCGAYENYFSVQGMSLEGLKEMNMPLAEGRLPGENTAQPEFVYGNQILAGFQNPKTNQGYWYTGEMPDINLMEDPIFLIYDTEAYYQSQNQEAGMQAVKPPKKYLAQSCGLTEGGPEDYRSYSWTVYCEIESLKKQLKHIFKNKPIPGQPLTASGKSYKQMYYNQINVTVDDMEFVSEVQSFITELGYQAHSNSEWVASMQKQYGYIQAVLGGIGAVSLFVAAIGITNTMMMSIYERTKEIGVMKVLGCDMKDIRRLFLMEAGMIGFLGGVTGMGLSFLISFVINRIVASMGTEMMLSYIPLWLSAASLLFAVFVGMVAGFFPALRAMQLSPLAAIRSE